MTTYAEYWVLNYCLSCSQLSPPRRTAPHSRAAQGTSSGKGRMGDATYAWADQGGESASALSGKGGREVLTRYVLFLLFMFLLFLLSVGRWAASRIVLYGTCMACYESPPHGCSISHMLHATDRLTPLYGDCLEPKSTWP